MFAVVRSGGKQFKVTEEMTIKVPSLPGKVGDEVTLTEVLLLSDGERRYTGNPTVKGASVSAELVRHGRDDKQTIFKYKRRKGYQRKQGHRQAFTEVRIKSITVPKSVASAKTASAGESPAKDADAEKAVTGEPAKN